MASGTRSQTTDTSTSPTHHGEGASVLFVCLGNICRSPMAEGVFRHLTRFNTPHQHPAIARIDSCGTGAYHAGSQPDPRTILVLADKGGITDYRHKARRIKVPTDFEEFDYILAMDESNYVDLLEMGRRAVRKGVLSEALLKKVRLYGSFGGRAVDEVVEDPWYDDGRDGFEVAFEQVERFGKGLLKRIETDAKRSID
ncbi:tyrosine protein phosphatase 1 [Neohortaea acidophila]|uniref:Tyrosine protein phosphatase 1 n=1 Tax=Neohortaea acidophila TaxID=245834 RepID=A0A6A6Q021_9PEZI|nr:tyrosine protein phosphatase 1 [Neohortaea acidophila]KAF2485033.1 tyrosine protein phosphatase 1 [Neohortaea acidophila]